jgi:vacuolar-type H+-ATPase subunit I/STV1
MGKVLSILIGLILIAVGIVLIVAGETWRAAVLVFVQGGIVIMLLIVGLGIFVFGLSELRAGAEEPPVVEPLPAPEKPTEETPSEPTESS